MNLSSAEEHLYALTTTIAKSMGTKHLLGELGHEVILVKHVDSQAAKVWAYKQRLGPNDACHAGVHACAKRRQQEAHDTHVCEHKAEQSKRRGKKSRKRSAPANTCAPESHLSTSDENQRKIADVAELYSGKLSITAVRT